MSVREHLAAVLKAGDNADPVFAWADSAGKARNTVLIQARKLGFKLSADNTWVFVGLPEDAPPRGSSPAPAEEPAPAVRVQRGRGTRKGFDYVHGVELELSLTEWAERISKAAATVQHRGCPDVLIMHDTPQGRRIAAEVYDY